MKKCWYRRFLIMVLLFGLFVGGGFSIRNAKQMYSKEEVSAKAASGDLLIPGGMPIGIYMETDGVMVLGTEALEGFDGLNYEPAKHLVKAGDYIVGINEKPVANKKELLEEIKNLTSDEVILKVRRKEEVIEVKIKPVKVTEKEYKLGIWVRDNAQGLGTITFLTGNSEFGALGHGIHDVDTNCLLYTSLDTLAEEIRQFLVEKISKTGGHLASNLGVVELTMAMHLAFSLPKDKIIWDVGHQAYTHKILTGRKAGFDDPVSYTHLSDKRAGACKK